MAGAVAEPPLAKRRKATHGGQDDLIEGLPDHIAEYCLSHVRRLFLISSVCRRWRRLIYSPCFPPFLSLYALFSEPGRHSVRFMSFDPVSSRWAPLPPPPPEHPVNRLLYRHPSFVSWKFPIQSIPAAGKLVIVSGTTSDLSPALAQPLVFDPISLCWTSGPTLDSPRRWCAVGTYSGVVYVASGIGLHYSADVARSVERWDLNRRRRGGSGWRWEKMGGLKDGRFSREAIDAVAWKGKLLMVNVKGDAAKEGVLYDVVKDEWEDMPKAMLAGWRGPVAAMAEETLYAADETTGSIKTYSEESNGWRDVIVESDERLKGAQQMVAAGGKLCVVAGGGRVVVVDVAMAPAKISTVETPAGMEPIAVHILPRMTQPDFC